MSQVKLDILSMKPEELHQKLVGMGWQNFRAKQLDEWLWRHAVRDFSEMTNLSKRQREELDGNFFIPALKLSRTQKSADGTMKFSFKLHDAYSIESVLIPVSEDRRYTLCVSSQAGCSLSCKFCATGQMGLLRQLTASEIFDQYMMVNKICKETYGQALTNIVYMGMGEPLLNYRNVLASINRLTSPKYVGMSSRRITLSTAGIEKMIRKLADDDVKVNLALSLHAADDEKRSAMMAINDSNNLKALKEAIAYFYKKTNGRISFEYIAFDGFNDHIADAKNLVRLCSHFPVRVNIIEYNPVSGLEFVKSSEEKLNDFAKEIRKHGIMVTVRRSRGKDIDAACGQLANIDQQG